MNTPWLAVSCWGRCTLEVYDLIQYADHETLTRQGTITIIIQPCARVRTIWVIAKGIPHHSDGSGMI
jgi:hypothetical protein